MEWKIRKSGGLIMRFYCNQKEEEIISVDALEAVLAERGHELVKSDKEAQIIIEPQQREQAGYAIKKEGKQVVLSYKEQVQFFRGLGQLLAHLEEQTFEKENNQVIGFNGAMYDCSRNGVLKVETIKKYIRLHALLGLNQMMLYTEETYEIEGYPYFGALRGRYTKEEIRECVAYGEMFGVELVPCIQTLAHLRTVLRWPKMAEYRDNDDILIAEEEKTYELIDSMLRSVRTMYKTNRIHLGMDEAFYLGYGAYRLKHGIVEQGQLIKRHLDKVMELCEKHGLEPMIWSDMFFVSGGNGGYYSVPRDHEWAENEKPDKRVSLVYWDYYAHDEEQYDRMSDLHKKLTDRIYFAGGGWTWNGMSPNYSQALEATKVGMGVMRQKGIVNSIYTLWHDNGAETPDATAIPMLAYYSNQVYGEELDEKEMEQWFRGITGESYQTMLLFDKMDFVPYAEKNNHGFANASKTSFYQDPLLGIFDKQFEGKGFSSHYKEVSKLLEQAKKENQKTNSLCGIASLYEYYQKFAEILSVKSELGIQIRAAYLEGDREALQQFVTNQLPSLQEQVATLLEMRRNIWFKEYKANGFEVIDIRFSGVIARLKSTALRLNDYLNGNVEQLEELEEERVYYLEEENKIPNCNLWEYIASASNIKDV